MSDPQAAQRRIDALVDDLIRCARAVEQWTGTLHVTVARDNLAAARDALQEAIAEYRTPEREPDGWVMEWLDDDSGEWEVDRETFRAEEAVAWRVAIKRWGTLDHGFRIRPVYFGAAKAAESEGA
jgi:hypothetical protein